MNWRKIPVLATLAVLAALAVMVKLGLWQLDRKVEKEALIARYNGRQSTFADIVSLPDSPLAREKLYYRTMLFCGGNAGWRAIAGRNSKGRAGYAHIARCTIAPGSYINSETKAPVAVTKGPIEVVLGWSTSPENPAWTGGTVAGIIAPNGKGIKVVADPPLAGLQANAMPDPRDLPNNHLAYAVQWFLFALTALVIYAIALRKRLAGAGGGG